MRTHRKTVLLAFLLSLATVQAYAQGMVRLPPRPAPCPGRWQGLIGRYLQPGDGHSSFLVREEEGKIELLGVERRRLAEAGRDTFLIDGGDGVEAVVFVRDSTDAGLACTAGGQFFNRSFYPSERGQLHKAATGLPMDSLWAEAKKAKPPAEKGKFAEPDLVDIKRLAPDVVVDQDYANPQNEYGFALYDRQAAILQRPAAAALARAAAQLRELGFALKIGDAYRPWHVTKFIRSAALPAERKFYANPAKGSHHNRGTAMDVTLVDLATGREADMGYGEDELSERAATDFPGGTSLQRWHRLVLMTALEQEGFRNLRTEWWHYRFISKRRYPIMNLPLSRAGSKKPAATAKGSRRRTEVGQQ